MAKIRSGFADIVRESVLSPEEAPLKLKKGAKSISIGVPRATRFQESRVSLKPDSVQVLVNSGLEVMVETNAGKLADFSDQDYSEAGAKIAYSRKEVFEAELILKVAPPSLEEIELMKTGAVLISAFQTGGTIH